MCQNVSSFEKEREKRLFVRVTTPCSERLSAVPLGAPLAA